MPVKKTNADTECRCPCCYGPWRIVGMVACALVLPLLLIWSLDTLFSLTIQYNLFTWFAALVVVLVFSGRGMKGWKGHGCTGCCGGKCDCVMNNKK